MAALYPFREAFQEITRRCEALFKVETADYGPALSEEELLGDLTKNDCQDKLAEQLLAYGRACSGFDLEWAPTAAQQELKLPGGYQGYIKLVSLADACSSWYEDLGGEVAEEYDPDLAQHLQEFRVVDNFHETGCVGVYCNENRDPQLYYYDSGEPELPDPLGVDLVGYVELLKLSLGYQHWQLLLIRLNEYFAAPAPRGAFQPRGETAMNEYFLSDMTVLNPDFTLEKFMVRYDEVRLRR